MIKFQNFMENKFIPISTKISNNKYLSAVSFGSVNLMSILIVGAIFSLFSSIAIKPYQEFITQVGLKNVFDFIPNATTNLMAIFMVLSVSFVASKNFGHSELSFNTSLLALVSFILLIPLNIIQMEGKFAPSTLIDFEYLGAKGIFLAIIIGLIVSRVYCFIVDKKWTITLPEGTPEQVEKSFAALIPAFIIFILFALIRYGFSISEFKSANNFIYSVLQYPIQQLTNSVPAMIIIVFLSQLLWFFGIHGPMTVLPIFIPIWIGYGIENAAAHATGQAIPHIYNAGIVSLTSLGGSGSTLGLVIVMLLFSKSKRYKTYSKVFFPCGIFNINEPVIFGLPMILNPLMLIPFLLTPLTIMVIAILLIKSSIMPAPIGILIPSSTPLILSGLIQGSWKLSIFEICAVLLSCGMYYPFFKLLDKQALTEEKVEENGDKQEIVAE